jgi:hypothetical protein
LPLTLFLLCGYCCFGWYYYLVAVACSIIATEVQYLSQFTNILLVTLYFYPQILGMRYHRSQIYACNFICIYCADVVVPVSDRSRVESMQRIVTALSHCYFNLHEANETSIFWTQRHNLAISLQVSKISDHSLKSQAALTHPSHLFFPSLHLSGLFSIVYLCCLAFGIAI